jgi:hypothetical protein
VGVEGDDDGLAVGFVGEGTEALEDVAVAAVDAVEDPDGDDGAAERGPGQRVAAGDDAHGVTAASRRRPS